MENFNAFMQGLFGTPMRLGWADWFPVKEVCLDGFDGSKGEYCFVDVGGGKGHEGELVLRKYPDTRGRFVVEDLGFVIEDITELDERIERLPHDFTKAQPIRGTLYPFPLLTHTLTHKQAHVPTSSKTSSTTGPRPSATPSSPTCAKP